MIHLDMEDLRKFALEALEEKGEDYVYEKVTEYDETIDSDIFICAYTETGDDNCRVPSCLVGNILHRAGVPLDRMRRNSLTASSLLVRLEDILETTPEVDRALRDMQVKQDSGHSWGWSVRSVLNLSE